MTTAAQQAPRVRPNGNVACAPGGASVAYDHPVTTPAGVSILRSTAVSSVEVLYIEGDAGEIADYLAVLAEIVRETNGLAVCAGCGFSFPAGERCEDDCGRCDE